MSTLCVATAADKKGSPASSAPADTGICSPSGASKVPGLVHLPLKVLTPQEWAWWKLILSTINGKLFFFDGWGSLLTAADGSDLPKETPIPDLPVEEPDFATLFGKNAPPAPTNGAGVRTTLGGADIDVTDKLTMTWVRDYRASSLTASDGTIDELCYSGQAGYSDRPRSSTQDYPVVSGA